jgi:hypothetical protein
MERFTVTRAAKGEMSGIRCNTCGVSSFLSRDAVEWLDTKVSQAQQTLSAIDPSTAPKQVQPVQILPEPKLQRESGAARWLKCRI